jgi:hypothetical protein
MTNNETNEAGASRVASATLTRVAEIALSHYALLAMTTAVVSASLTTQSNDAEGLERVKGIEPSS